MGQIANRVTRAKVQNVHCLAAKYDSVEISAPPSAMARTPAPGGPRPAFRRTPLGLLHPFGCGSFLREFRLFSRSVRQSDMEQFTRDQQVAGATALRQPRRIFVGKYFLAWLLGVPAVVLVVIYIFMH
jgi:hypothetical protein